MSKPLTGKASYPYVEIWDGYTSATYPSAKRMFYHDEKKMGLASAST
jgi:hypothetical protein